MFRGRVKRINPCEIKPAIYARARTPTRVETITVSGRIQEAAREGGSGSVINAFAGMKEETFRGRFRARPCANLGDYLMREIIPAGR